MCQRASQSDSKWPRQTRTNTHTDSHTHTHFRIYISRDYDLIGISESNLTGSETLDFEKFNLLKTKARPNVYKTSGGISVLVKEDIAHLVKYIPSESELVLWVEVDKKLLHTEESIIIGVVYVPCEGSIYT